jgi:hypothetical protein
MESKKTLFVTCFYNGLDNTILGGRVGRLWHYFYGIQTIINIGCEVVVYTSEQDKIHLDNAIKQSKYPKNVRVIIYDLFTHPYHEYFQKLMNGTKTDRCNEIMHGKTLWMSNHINESYDYIYWIDCGLSHGGLFPKRFRDGDGFNDYFSCNLFNNKMVKNLNRINDKIVILYGDQTYHIFESAPNSLFFKEKSRDENCHIVGGMFGGHVDLVKKFCEDYENLMIEMKEYNCLEPEEKLLTVLYFRNKEMFHTLKFTTWHHEEVDLGICCNHPNDTYFYKIYENLND